MIKYLRNNDRIEDCLTVDEFGNRVSKADGSYVIVVAETSEDLERQPISLTKIGDNWVPRQTELNFDLG